MADGDLITGDWQMERGSLLVGDGTSYDLRVVDGLASQPEVRSQDRALLLRHGSVAGLDYLGVRSFTVEFDVIEPTAATLSTLVAALSAAFVASESESVVAFQIPGVAAGVKSQVSARVRRRDIPIGFEFAQGVVTVAIEFVATDPRIYSQVESSVSVGLASNGGGLEFAASPDFTFGAVSTGGEMTVENEGDFPAPVVFRIDGPCTDPVIENQTVGSSIKLNLVVAASTYVLVDTEARTILLNGTASRYSALDSTSVWFDLAAGNNTIDFKAATTTAATCSATWRDAWS